MLLATDADLVDDDVLHHGDSCLLSADALAQRLQALGRRIDARCAGLVEVGVYGDDPPIDMVSFIHRSAVDFVTGTAESRRLLACDGDDEAATAEARRFAVVRAQLISGYLSPSIPAEHYSTSVAAYLNGLWKLSGKFEADIRVEIELLAHTAPSVDLRFRYFPCDMTRRPHQWPDYMALPQAPLAAAAAARYGPTPPANSAECAANLDLWAPLRTLLLAATKEDLSAAPVVVQLTVPPPPLDAADGCAKRQFSRVN